MGYWGQARVTGHEATRGTEQDRQIGTFALSRARKLAKRPESTVRRLRETQHVRASHSDGLRAAPKTPLGHRNFPMKAVRRAAQARFR
jgi:hypothetical protein